MSDNDFEDRLRRDISALPRELEPGRDLWPGIESRLEPRGRRAWVSAAVAASLVLSSLSVLFTWNLYQQQQAQTQMLQAQLQALESPYLPVRASYDREWATLRTRLDPATATTIERNVAIIRQANAELMKALNENPRDESLRKLLMKTLATEADVYQQAFGAATRVSLAANGESADARRFGGSATRPVLF